MKNMRSVAFVAALTLSAANAAAQDGRPVGNLFQPRTGEWTYRIFQNDWRQIANWLNLTCKPKDATGVFGTIKSFGYSSDYDYTVYVWCRNDGAKSWKLDTLESRDPNFPSQTILAVQNGAALIGVIKGLGGDGAILVSPD